MRKSMALILCFTLLVGCAPATPIATETPTPLPFVTATLRPTFTARPSATLAPPTIAPTIEPVSGTITTQVNVRAAPDQNGTSLGLLEYAAQVNVIGRDTSSTWLMVIYPEKSSTTAWVAASFVQLSSEIEKLPVIQVSLPAFPADTAVAQPAATATENARTAKVTKTINVRTGPASAFESLGLIDAGTMVALIGRNEINTWIQIAYAGGPDGKGWVAAAYVEGANLQGLPVFGNDGKPLATPAPGTVAPGQPTATAIVFSEAPTDGDSEENPAAKLEFSPTGSQSFTYSSELSSPTGDDMDWVAFIPYMPTSEAGYVYMRLRCIGNGGVTAILEKDGTPVSEVPQLVCGNYGLAMKVLGGQTYMLVLRADGSGGPLRYVNYTLTISVNP